MKGQTPVLCNKLLHSRSLMPGSIIEPKVDNLSLEAGHNLCKHLQETFRISTHPFHDTMPSVERVHPSEKIQALSMLALCIDIGLCTFLAPYSPKLRMERKTRLILKKYYPLTVASSGEAEFFLTCREIPSHRNLWPAHIGEQAAARSSRVSLSVAERGELAPLCNVPSSDTLPRQSHPSDFVPSRNPGETLRGLYLEPSSLSHQIEKVSRIVAGPSQLQDLLGCPAVSTLPPPIGSTRKIQQLVSTSTQTGSTKTQRSEFRSMPRGFVQPCVAMPPGLNLGALNLVVSCHPSRSVGRETGYMKKSTMSTYL